MSNPNREWISENNRVSLEFRNGVAEFIRLARQQVVNGKVKCPCKTCNNVKYQTIDDVETDLYIRGFSPNYKRWFHHGEPIIPEVIEDDESIDESEDEGLNDALHDILDHDEYDPEYDPTP